MNPFNPTQPCVIGTEWFPFGQFPQYVNSDVGDAGTMELSVESSVTETIDAVWFWSFGNTAAAFALEIYDFNDFDFGDTAAAAFYPTVDYESSGAYTYNNESLGGTSNIWQVVDNTTQSPALPLLQDVDYFTGIFGAGARASFQFAGLTGAFTGKPILSLQVWSLVDVINYAPEHPSNCTFITYLIIDGVTYRSNPVTARQFPGGWLLADAFRHNPATGGVWTVAALERFDAGGDCGAGIMIVGSNSLSVRGAVDNLALVIEYGTTEKRIAHGVWTNPHPGWNRIPIEQLDGAGTWAKANGDKYLVGLRRLGAYEQQVIMWVPIDVESAGGSNAGNPGVVHGQECTYSPYFRTLVAIEHDNGSAPPILLERDDTDISVDGQPYESVDTDDWANIGSVVHLSLVNTGQTAQQDLTAPASDDYGFVQALVAVQDARTLPSADLAVTLRRRSDDVVMAGPHNITLDDLAAPYGPYQLVEFQFVTPGTLVSGVQYYLEFTSSAAAGAGWKVQALSTFRDSGLGAGPATRANASIGGAADTGHTLGLDYLDFAVSLHTIPDPPAGFSAAPAGTATAPTVQLDWTATDVGAGGCVFDRYEIDRSDNGGTTWHRIAELTTEATDTYTDPESLIGSLAQYRLRVRRADHAVSLWVTASTTLTSTRCGFFLSSAEAPADSLWYDDLRTRDFVFADDTKILQFFDRDGAVAFRSLEDPYDEIPTTLLIASEGGDGGTVEATVPGRKPFDPLLELIGQMKNRTTGLKTTTSYICVRTSENDRWFANIRVAGNAERFEPGGLYTIKVVIRETTRTPSVALVS
jgi:hypothetical protein